MTRHMPALSRRGVLLGLGGALTLGRTRLAFAAGPSDKRLVVIVLRGAMDGLSVVHPYADPAYRDLRGALALPEPGREGGLLDLGGFFGLHPAMPKLHALYRAGQVLPVQAVAGPYRSRSHFDAQDYLESGADQRLSSGWLNRALGAFPADAREQAIAVGTGTVPLLLRGPAPVGTYAPSAQGRPSEVVMQQISTLYGNDLLLGPALGEGLRGRGFTAATLGAAAPRNGGDPRALALSAGRLLASAGGPRIAAMEIDGWDTHVAQTRRLDTLLGGLDETLDGLREGLGEAWGQSVILALTEFGRTVRINGTGGTDHGTAGLALLLGGAVRGGRMLADWPGLAEDRLFEKRDLQPTRDLRALAQGVLRDHLGLGPQALAAAFPGGRGVRPEAGLLRG